MVLEMKEQRKSDLHCRVTINLGTLFVQLFFIESNGIRDEGAKEIGLALQINNSLTALNLGMFFVQLFFIENNEIKEEGAKEIRFGLQKNKTLIMLNLGIQFA
eukprot:TRINITY_DN832_c0_g1_i10.p3 TRINITY_DN832_c0_g1~~TRINITY_DN832_c0_g1_i10.p3  ORF type:complete len:110 (-),score=6.62 TRINITY_DN832_c0_g1_i10:375-683(-)